MMDPRAIYINTDGAMDYDSRQTGGTGFLIEFPETTNYESIKESFRRDNQGVHRLEMIAILEAMKALLKWLDSNREENLDCSRVIIRADRISITDCNLSNIYLVSKWRRNRWKTSEGKPIKNQDLVEKIDKMRAKLGNKLRCFVEIEWVPRKRNRIANKLSIKGKKSENKSRTIIQEKSTKVAPRIFDGSEIKYSSIKVGDSFDIRAYMKDPVQKECEITAEICDGEYIGKKIKIYIDFLQELDIHRHYSYRVNIESVYKYHVKIRSDYEELGIYKSEG